MKKHAEVKFFSEKKQPTYQNEKGLGEKAGREEFHYQIVLIITPLIFLIGVSFCLELLSIQDSGRAWRRENLWKPIPVGTTGLADDLLCPALLNYRFIPSLAGNHSNVQLTGRIGHVFSA